LVLSPGRSSLKTRKTSYYSLLCCCVVRICDWFIQKCGPYLLSKILCARCQCFSIKRWSFFLVSFSFSRALDYFFSMFSVEYARDVTVLVLKSGLLSFFLSLSISRFRALFTTSSRCYCCCCCCCCCCSCCYSS